MNAENSTGNAIRLRDSNIELLRIVLMFFIVLHHLIVHGSGLLSVDTLPNSFGTYQKLFFESFLLFPVDCFVFISGYFGLRLTFKRLGSLWLQCFFYSVSVMLFFKLSGLYAVTTSTAIKSFFPILTDQWWFFTCYFFLFLLSPAINAFVEGTERRMHEYALAVCCVLNCVVSFISHKESLGGTGSTLTNFVFLYLLGKYFRSYFEYGKIKTGTYLTIFFGCCVTVFLLTLAFFISGRKSLIWHLYQFNNPLLIVEAICAFFIFKKRSFTVRTLNTLGGMVFAVYLIHDSALCRGYIYAHVLRINEHAESWSYGFYLLLFAAVIMAFSFLVEFVRAKLCEPLLETLARTGPFARAERFLAQTLEKRR